MSLIVLILVLLAGNGLLAQQETPATLFCQDSIKTYLAEYNVPAIGVGIIEDGVLRHIKVHGELKANTPAPYNAFFNIASLSKPITALLTLRLVSAGDWDLDDPLYHYWIDPDVKDDPSHKKLTSRHVLTHQTGFDNWRWNNESKKLTFNFEPGTKCKYSGEGFEYLRHAMERKFDKPIEELVDSLIFKPYGMTDTRLLWDESFHQSRYAEEHNGEGKPYHLWKRIENACASDDVLTTIEDYCLFGVNVMRGTGLAKEVHQDMLTYQGFVDDNGGFGLGWWIAPNFYHGEYAVIHDGSDAGVATKVILLPESKRGIVMLTNGDNGFDIIKKVEAEYFSSDNLKW